MAKFQPMLADPVERDKLCWPAALSPKYDGVRVFVHKGKVLTRKLKPVLNHRVQARLRHLEGFDGELIFGPPTAKDVFQRSQSGIKLEGGEDFMLYAFDCMLDPHLPWIERFKVVQTRDSVIRVPHKRVANLAQMDVTVERYLEYGYEGGMYRRLYAPYKFGRSTADEGGLLKVKPFVHHEAVVVDIFERDENTNEATLDERGYTKRSSAKAGKVGKGTLGGFIVRMFNGPFEGVLVRVGTGNGWTDAERQRLWDLWHREGKFGFIAEHPFMRVKYQEIGSKDKPRGPVFDGWRSLEDMSK